LFVENSETIAPSSPASHEWSVFGGGVYCSPGPSRMYPPPSTGPCCVSRARRQRMAAGDVYVRFYSTAAATERLLLARLAHDRWMSMFRAPLVREHDELLCAHAVGIHVDADLQADFLESVETEVRNLDALTLARRQDDSGLVEHGRRTLARLAFGHGVILGSARATVSPICLRRARHEDLARNLGVRFDGYKIRSGRLQARAREPDDQRTCTTSCRRSRRPDGRLRIPLPARAECGEPRRGERGARRARHLLPRIRAPSRPTVRKRWPDLAGPGDARRSREADARRDRLRRRARRALHHLARDRGLQLSVSDALRGELGLVRRRNRPGGRALPGAWNSALSRAQELGAGNEDPHA